MSCEFSDFFSDKNVLVCFKTALRHLYQHFNENESSYVDQEVYEAGESSINIFCYKQKFTLEFLANSEVKDCNFTTLLTSVINLDDQGCDIEKYISNVAESFTQIYLKISEVNPELKHCIHCKEIFVPECLPGTKSLSEGNLIDGLCEKCEAPMFLKLRKFVNKNVNCDICCCNLLEKVDEKKIQFNKMLQVNCCKGKTICENCYEKLDSHNNCECGSCDIKCPFCKQNIKVSSNLN